MAAYASGSLVSQLWNDCRYRGCGWYWAALCCPVSAVRSDGCSGGRCSPRPHGRRLRDGMTATWQSSILPVGRCCLLFSASLLFGGALAGEAGSFPIRRLVNDFAADHGQQDFRLADFGRLDQKQILGEHDDVGELAW